MWQIIYPIKCKTIINFMHYIKEIKRLNLWFKKEFQIFYKYSLLNMLHIWYSGLVLLPIKTYLQNIYSNIGIELVIQIHIKCACIGVSNVNAFLWCFLNWNVFSIQSLLKGRVCNVMYQKSQTRLRVVLSINSLWFWTLINYNKGRNAIHTI